MIVFVLMIIVQIKTAEGFSTDYLTKVFNDRTQCEITEGESLTAASQNDQITGYIVVHDCDNEVAIPKKA